jgi:hypothetical protein
MRCQLFIHRFQEPDNSADRSLDLSSGRRHTFGNIDGACLPFRKHSGVITTYVSIETKFVLGSVEIDRCDDILRSLDTLIGGGISPEWKCHVITATR